MRVTCFLTILGLLFSAEGAASPCVVTPVHPTEDVVLADRVLDPSGNALSNRTDDIQRALDAVGRLGGGTVFLRRGVYRLEGALHLPVGVTLRGDYDPQKPRESSVLSVVGGKGTENGAPTVSMPAGSGLVGLVFYYPEQSSSSPVAYPWTIKSTPPTDALPNENQTVSDCTIVNAWRGISIGPERSELHLIRRTRICALKTGVAIDTIYDTGRLDGILVSPAVWVESGFGDSPTRETLRNCLFANGAVAVDCGRSDWEMIFDLDISDYAVGLQFRPGRQWVSEASVTGCRIRNCGRALSVEALNGSGLAVHDCVLGGDYGLWVDEKLGRTTVQLKDVEIDGKTQVRGKAMVLMTDCRCRQETDVGGKGGFAALGCKMAGVRAQGPLERFWLLGCEVSGALENKVKYGDVRVDPKATRPSFCRCDSRSLRMPRGERFPACARIYDVKEFGASVDLEDNAAAFQRALDAAGATGGVVYAAPGQWRFANNLVVPSGVELRGASAVPHHTISGGTVFLPYHGENDPDGVPFVRLQPNSGIRGFTVWYPKQPVEHPAVEYPWTVRTLGKDCRITDVNIANGWKGVDLASVPSDGHRISYLSGSLTRNILSVKGAFCGWIEHSSFNEHYAIRIPKDLPVVHHPSPAGLRICALQRDMLTAYSFSDCADERVRGLLSYAGNRGLEFLGGGRVNALICAFDTVANGVYSAQDKGGVANVILPTITPWSVRVGGVEPASVCCSPENKGRVNVSLLKSYCQYRTLVCEGGEAVLDTGATSAGPLTVRGGRAFASGIRFAMGQYDGPLAETDGRGGLICFGCQSSTGLFAARGARTQFCSRDGVLDPENYPKSPFAELRLDYRSSSPVENRFKALRGVEGQVCEIVADPTSRSGKAVRLAFMPRDTKAAYAYAEVSDRRIPVWPGTILEVDLKPMNDRSRRAGIDLEFDDGTALRAGGGTVVTCGADAKLGEWRHVRYRLGVDNTGKTITSVRLCWDVAATGGDVECLYDGITITTPRLPPGVSKENGD